MDQGDGTRPAGTIEIGVRRLRSELAWCGVPVRASGW
jgi:hypothetical protein